MKTKLLLLAILLSATISHAASFKWSAAAPAAFDGTKLEGTAKGYLVYLGTSTSASDLFTIDYTAPGTITPATSVQNVTSGTGRAAGAISATYKDTDTGDDGHHVATGAHFGMFLVYNDGTDTWYNFSSTVATITTDATGAFEAKSFAFDYSTKTTIESDGQTPSGWTKINIVPEPSTAMLALAGLALLIKRRRA